MGNVPLEVAPGQGQIHVNSYNTDVRPYTEAKLSPGSVSCPEAMSCPESMLTGPKRLFLASRGKVLEDKRKRNLPRGNPYIKTNLHTGCFRKITKNGEHKSPPVHTFIWRFSIVSIGNQQNYAVFPIFSNIWDTLYLSLIKRIRGKNISHNHNLLYKSRCG